MDIIILEAHRVGKDQFKLVFEEKPKKEDTSPLQFTRTRLNPVTKEVETEIFYLHHLDREDVRYLIYFNGRLTGMEVGALETALDKYIAESQNSNENVVEKLISSKGFTEESLAKSIDVDICVIKKFVTGGELPKGTHGLRLAEKLNITIDALMDISKQRHIDWVKNV